MGGIRFPFDIFQGKVHSPLPVVEIIWLLVEARYSARILLFLGQRTQDVGERYHPFVHPYQNHSATVA